MIAFILI